MTPFFGRNHELERLKRYLKKKTSSLRVIRGRRRIGKSRLAMEFGRNLQTFIFSGLPPADVTNITAQTQREEFARQMQREVGILAIRADDWGDLFWHLSQRVKKGRILVILDEITWMGSKDPAFLGKLKIAWDLYFKNTPKLIMILSGSMSGWIEKNILSSTGFVGRISLDMVLDELPLHVCNQFWGKNRDRISSYEKFKILSVTGGVPRYLEEIDPDLTAEENIHLLGFQKGSLFFREFDRIFSDLFSKRSGKYKKIVVTMAKGTQDINGICKLLEIKKGGLISDYLEDLVETGYVARDLTWTIKDGKRSQLSRYRLKDNYLRFYLKYIEPNKAKIEAEGSIKVPAWYTIMGLQFENLVVNNRKNIYRILGIPPDEVVVANPYFQRSTREHPSCQIDFMIQSRFNTLYLCEIKFSKEKVGKHVINEMEEKIRRLHTPRQFSIRPVLIHVNDVTDSVIECGYFSNIINFSEFLCKT